MRALFALIDGGAIAACLALAWLQHAPDRFVVTLSCVLLLVWQAVENGYLRRRFQVAGLASYPGGLAHVNAIFALALVLGASDRWFESISFVARLAWLGAALCAAGMVLRWASFRAIGSDFLRAPGDVRLLQRSGPYRLLRHPAGWGFFLIGFGTALAWSSALALAVVALVLLPALGFVHRHEERKNRMHEGFYPRRFMDAPLTIFAYEALVHPVFLAFFTRLIGFERLYRALRSLAPNTVPPALVIDLACGTGWFARRRARDVPRETQIVGIDVSPNMLVHARRSAQAQGIPNEQVSFREGDAVALADVASGAACEVWLCGALHQVEDPERVTREVARVLRPGGHFYLQTFVEGRSAWSALAARWLAKAQFRFFKRTELLHMLRDAGFSLRGQHSSGSVLLVCAERVVAALPRRRVLVVGGTGCTGRLIADKLKHNDPLLEVDLGARRADRPNRPAAGIGTVALDLRYSQQAVATLRRYDFVVLALGPFEAFGSLPHRLCVEAAVPCLDINDSQTAVQAILEEDARAKQSGVLILTGMGLSPGLTTLLLFELVPHLEADARVRLRLFVGGGQDAGRSAIQAMLSSFTPGLWELHQGQARRVRAEERSGEAAYRFSEHPRARHVIHYPTPEALTLPRLRPDIATRIRQLDYRVHFQGMPLPLVRAVRAAPLLRHSAFTRPFSALVHTIHDIMKSRKDRCALVDAQLADAQGAPTLTVSVRTQSSYDATAIFAAAMTQLALQGRLRAGSGVHTLETAIEDPAELRGLLGQHGIRFVGPRREVAHAAAE